MRLSSFGAIVEEEWLKTPMMRQEIELDEFIIMPNHFHGIVFIVGAHGDAPSSHVVNPMPSSKGGNKAG